MMIFLENIATRYGKNRNADSPCTKKADHLGTFKGEELLEIITMPLIVPTIEKITNLETIKGKKLVDERDVALIESMKDAQLSDVVFQGQLDDHVLIKKMGTEKKEDDDSDTIIILDENDVILLVLNR
jgi:hypothetical protein